MEACNKLPIVKMLFLSPRLPSDCVISLLSRWGAWHNYPRRGLECHHIISAPTPRLSFTICEVICVEIERRGAELGMKGYTDTPSFGGFIE